MREERLTPYERLRVSSLGGLARASKLKPSRRSQIAKAAAEARWRAWRAELDAQDTEGRELRR